MKKMPCKIKNQLRKLAKVVVLLNKTDSELTDLFNEYNIDVENLTGTPHNIYSKEPSTEALTCIGYGEGDVETNIAEIEKVFLWQVNNRKENET